MSDGAVSMAGRTILSLPGLAGFALNVVAFIVYVWLGFRAAKADRATHQVPRSLSVPCLVTVLALRILAELVFRILAGAVLAEAGVTRDKLAKASTSLFSGNESWRGAIALFGAGAAQASALSFSRAHLWVIAAPALSALAAFLVFETVRIVTRRKLGFADVLFAAAGGALLPFTCWTASALLACVFAAFEFLRQRSRAPVAFVPCLTTATVFVWLAVYLHPALAAVVSACITPH